MKGYEELSGKHTDVVAGNEADNDDHVQPFFKLKEAYVISVFIGLVALLLEYYLLFSDSSGSGNGKLIGAIPVLAFMLIKSVLKNSKR